MIKIVNTEYRNIQEQVAKNASDIADLDTKTNELDTKIDETKEEITGGSSLTIDDLYQQNVGQDNSIYQLQTGKQNKLTAGSGIDITDNVISSTASGGTQLYIHEFTWSGGSGSFAYVMGAYISANSTPVTNFQTLNNIIYGGNRNGAKTMRIGYAAGGSIYGNFMFGFNSSLVFTMIVFSNDGSTQSATIGQGGNLTGTWTETVIEL